MSLRLSRTGVYSEHRPVGAQREGVRPSGRTPLPCCNLSGAQFTARRTEEEWELAAAALKQLSELPDGEYVGLLAGLAAEASSTGREEVILSQKDRARYGKQVVTQANERLGDGHLTLSVQTRPIRGGLILSDGDVEVNCTFETLVRLLRGEMDRTVVEVLFG